MARNEVNTEEKKTYNVWLYGLLITIAGFFFGVGWHFSAFVMFKFFPWN